MKKAALVTLILSGMASAALADECASWTHKGYPVTMEACSYTSGGSGYYKITNDGDRAAAICWSIVASNGQKYKRCNSHVEDGETTQGSCFECGTKNGGATLMLESYTVKE